MFKSETLPTYLLTDLLTKVKSRDASASKNRTSQLMAIMKPHRLQNELVIPGQVEYRPAGTRVAQLSKILIAN